MIEVQRRGERWTINSIYAGIREKWLHFPRLAAQKDFTPNAEPFKYFDELVNLRNDLIHFNVDRLTFEARPVAYRDGR